MSSLNEDQLTIRSIELTVKLSYLYVVNETYEPIKKNYLVF